MRPPPFVWPPPPSISCCLEQASVLLGEVATPGPECELSILAAFHRKPDLTDRTGRKQVGVEPGSREGWHRTSKRGAVGWKAI